MESKCKICRRAGEKLFLKGEKCYSPKCTLTKKPYPPGMLQSEKKHRSTLTEFGRQMKEKQKTRNSYGMRERQFVGYVEEALGHTGNPAELLFGYLEFRLDNAVFRAGFAHSRALARQLVSHGHVTVNGRKMTIPSYRVKNGDVIGVREGSKGSALFTDMSVKLEKRSAPTWMTLDAKSMQATIIGTPKAEEAVDAGIDLSAVVGFYTR
ncbi:MAG: 30S ribosomal protein S4 [Candidatus Yonathbacteria bacterium]|nr:30S ribosomal protein S4 [Candidatus Yonathbacteria bacterium]